MTSVQQTTAAQAIKSEFLRTKLRYAILRAKCQSGKTGAYHCLINLMLTEGLVERAYILCGSNEIELRQQAIADAETHNSAHLSAGRIVVAFRQDFEALTMNLTNTLIIVDESHMDQGKKQQLHKFLRRHELTMDGNPATLAAKNAYIVSVSATPYSEVAALVHEETPYQKIETELEAGDGYYGLEQYMYNHKLHPTFDIEREPAKFQDLLAAAGKKWVLMRMASCKTSTRIEDWMKSLPGLTVLEFTVGKTEVAITRVHQEELLTKGVVVPCLEDEPAQTTVVIIRGRLRAGKVVPKHHIAFVWEGAKLSKTDSIVQGLAGRMCGYVTAGAGKADIYIPASSLHRDEAKVVSASEIGRALMTPVVSPTRFTNAAGSRIPNKAPNGRTQCPPIKFDMISGGDSDWWEHKVNVWDKAYSHGGDRIEFAEACVRAALNQADVILRHPKLSEDQKAEILSKLRDAVAEPNNVHVRYIHKESASSQKSYYRDLLDHHRDQTTHTHHISGCESLNFVICLKDYNEFQSRYVHAVFYTDAGAPLGLPTVPADAKVPRTNGKSIFSLDSSAAGVSGNAVAAGMITLDSSAVQTPAKLTEALDYWIRTSLTAPDTVTVGRTIVSVRERFSLPLEAFHYVSTKNNDVERICATLSARYGVKVVSSYTRSGDRHFNLKSISW